MIVHDREAHGDCLEIVSRYDGLRGVFHCFSGSAEMAAELLRRGWYLGFDGPVTYKNARKAIEVLELCPLDRILLETDSPYLSPVPMRGRRNDSRNLRYIAQKIGEIKGITERELALAARDNGRRLFGIGRTGKKNFSGKKKMGREQSFRCAVLKTETRGRLTAADPERRNRPRKPESLARQGLRQKNQTGRVTKMKFFEIF